MSSVPRSGSVGRCISVAALAYVGPMSDSRTHQWTLFLQSVLNHDLGLVMMTENNVPNIIEAQIRRRIIRDSNLVSFS